jgi:hypothetical protein
LLLPSTERSHQRKKGLLQQGGVNVFPTFHWLIWYHMQLTSDTDHYRDVVRSIAACGSPNQLELCDSNGWTALTLACDLGDAEVVRLLVGRGDLCLGQSGNGTGTGTGTGAVSGAVGKNKTTPLERAIRCNSYACVSALISGGAAITPEALHLAIERFGVVKLMDPPPPANPDEEAFLRERQRAMFPSRSLQLDSLQQLLLQERERERKAHAEESEYNSIEIVRHLAESGSGSDILTALNSAGRTALEEAVHLAKPEVAAILQKAHEANTAATEDAILALMGLAFK